MVLRRTVLMNFRVELARSTPADVTGMTRTSWKMREMFGKSKALASMTVLGREAGRFPAGHISHFFLHSSTLAPKLLLSGRSEA